MTDCLEAIKTRRSIRKYEDKDIPEDVMHSILDSARWAPSWANTQCCDLVVIREKSIREELQKIVSKGNPSTLAIVNAPVLLAVCGKLKSSGYYKGQAPTKFGDWFMYDVGIATQNICLAAHALGVGSVIVGLFDHDKAKEILKAPDDMEVITLIPLGYPAQNPSAPKRRELVDVAHYNTF